MSNYSATPPNTGSDARRRVEPPWESLGVLVGDAAQSLSTPWRERHVFVDVAPHLIGLLGVFIDDKARPVTLDDLSAWGRTAQDVVRELEQHLAERELSVDRLEENGVRLLRVADRALPTISPAARMAAVMDAISEHLDGQRPVFFIASNWHMLVAFEEVPASVDAGLTTAEGLVKQGFLGSPLPYTWNGEELEPWLPTQEDLAERVRATALWAYQTQHLAQQEYLQGEGSAWLAREQLGLLEEPGTVLGPHVEIRASRFADAPGGLLVPFAHDVTFVDDTPEAQGIPVTVPFEQVLRDLKEIIPPEEQLRPVRFRLRRFPNRYELGDLSRATRLADD